MIGLISKARFWPESTKQLRAMSDRSAMTCVVVSFHCNFLNDVHNELARLEGNVDIEPLGSGVGLARIRDPIALARRLAERPPIYIQHLFPVHQRVAMPVPRGVLETRLADAARNLPIDPQRSLQVQLRSLVPTADREPLEERLERWLAARAAIDPRHPEQMVFGLLTDRELLLGACPVGFSVSRWNGGIYPAPADRDRINRAELKLLEALDSFHIRLPRGARAVDLGAAPGGWTRVLLASGATVTAVDPAPLVPTLQRDRRVRHLGVTTQAWLDQGPDPCDFITNDMMVDPRDSARLMVACAPFVRVGGSAIMTLKFNEGDRRKATDHALRILRGAWRIPRIRQLYYNRNEVTLWLKKR